MMMKTGFVDDNENYDNDDYDHEEEQDYEEGDGVDAQVRGLGHWSNSQ